jgi:hypothetical protein
MVFGGFLSHRDTPIAGRFIMENPNLKWMIFIDFWYLKKHPFKAG